MDAIGHRRRQLLGLVHRVEADAEECACSDLSFFSRRGRVPKWSY